MCCRAGYILEDWAAEHSLKKRYEENTAERRSEDDPKSSELGGSYFFLRWLASRQSCHIKYVSLYVTER